MSSHPKKWTALCEDAELAVECGRLADALGLPLDPVLSDDPLGALGRSTEAAAALLVRPPSIDALVAASGLKFPHPRPIALLGESEAVWRARNVAADLGLAVVDEVRPLLAALALLGAGATRPWTASARSLTDLDRARIGQSLTPARGSGRIVKADAGLLAWSQGSIETLIGEPKAVGAALACLRTHSAIGPRARAVMSGVDRRQAQQVIFGPRRALSDPASKSALAPYGLPLPMEELCTSPSRAASEATRFGFPVRIALASPDLRLWDHPDLAVDGVDNAARVRDVYRTVMAMAADREPDARLLGVTVSATTRPTALLRVVARPIGEPTSGLSSAEIGFADPHGRAAGDRTWTVLPLTAEAVERVAGRLRAASLLLGTSPVERKHVIAALTDVLVRLAVFADDHRHEVEEIKLQPIACLVGGGLEIREACIAVSDAFQRSFEAPANSSASA